MAGGNTGCGELRTTVWSVVVVPWGNDTNACDGLCVDGVKVLGRGVEDGNTTLAGVVSVRVLVDSTFCWNAGRIFEDGRLIWLRTLFRLLPLIALGSLSADVISMTLESSAIIVSRAVDARGARVVRK